MDEMLAGAHQPWLHIVFIEQVCEVCNLSNILNIYYTLAIDKVNAMVIVFIVGKKNNILYCMSVLRVPFCCSLIWRQE